MSADLNLSAAALHAENTAAGGSSAWSESLRLSLANRWNWLRRQSKELLSRQATRRLRVTETVSLGEKRFVSILEVDGEQFLLGGSTSSLVLLAKLEGSLKEQPTTDQATFAEVLSRVSKRVQTSATDFSEPHIKRRGA